MNKMRFVERDAATRKEDVIAREGESFIAGV